MAASPPPELPDPELAAPPPRAVEPVHDPARLGAEHWLGRTMFGFFVIMTFLWAVLLAVSAWPWLRLRLDGREVAGVVVARDDFSKERSLASAFHYRLRFDFVDQTGKLVLASASVRREVFDRARVGDPIRVRYDPARPGRWVEVPGQTQGPGRFTGVAALQLVFCATFAIAFSRVPSRRRRLLRTLCVQGHAVAGTVVSSRGLWPSARRLVKVRYRDAGRERTVTLRLTQAQEALFPPGAPVSLLRHRWHTVPYRLLPFRIAGQRSP